MALPASYKTGTATATNGSTAVVGQGTAWSLTVQAGDEFFGADGRAAEVLSVTDDTHIVLEDVWPGTTQTAGRYRIRYAPDGSRALEKARQVIEMLGELSNTGFQISAFGNFVDRALHDTAAADYVYLSMDGDGALVTTPTIFIKNSATSGDWSAGIDFQAPAQPEHFDLALFAQGLYADGDLLFRHEFTDTVVFASGLSGSKFSSGVAATGSVALSLKANGVSFGTVNFAAGVTEATFTAAADQTFAPGDVLTVVAPNPKDASIADVSGVLRGSRDAVASINQSGLAVLNFGNFPGTDLATIAVTGESGITGGSLVEAWIWPGAGTAEHSADEHKVASIKITPSDVVAGTGFTLNGYATDGRQYGRFNVAWRWL